VWRSLRLLDDSGRLYLWLAVFVLYVSMLAYGIVGHDDAWLVRDSGLVQTPS